MVRIYRPDGKPMRLFMLTDAVDKIIKKRLAALKAKKIAQDRRLPKER